MSNAASRLTPSQREEIARGHDRERPRELARRLGLPRLVVEEEVRRLRGADAVSMRRPWNLLALSTRIGGLLLFAAVVLGITELLRHWREAPAAAATEPPPAAASVPAESEAAREVYEQIDAGEALGPEELAARLEDPDVTVRLAAVRAYVQAPPVGRDPRPILPRLNDIEERVRLATIQGLGVLGEPRAIQPLAAIVTSGRSTTERGLALQALGEIPDDAALPPVVDALADPVASIRQRAFGVLTRRLGTDLGCTAERLQAEPEAVRDLFRQHLQERAR